MPEIVPRHTVAGCDPEDPMALALGEYFDGLSQGWPYVCFNDSKEPSAYWEPIEGGWVIYSREWARGEGVPRSLKNVVIPGYRSRRKGQGEFSKDYIWKELCRVLYASYSVRMRRLNDVRATASTGSQA